MTDPRIEAAAWMMGSVSDLAPGGDWERLTPYQKTHFRRLAKAVLDAADAAAWRPIETAPKGRENLVDVWAGGRRYTDAFREDGEWYFWITDSYDASREEEIMATVTHWQPLPAPPASIAELGGVDG